MTNLEELSQLSYACRRLWRPVGSERREQRPRTQCEVSYVLGRLNLRTCSQKATPSSDPFTSSITMENMHLRTEISFDFALITEVYSRKTRHGDRGIGMVSMDTLKGYWSRPSERQTPPVKIKGERKQVAILRGLTFVTRKWTGHLTVIGAVTALQSLRNRPMGIGRLRLPRSACFMIRAPPRDHAATNWSVTKSMVDNKRHLIVCSLVV
ncbi:hypothetical protein BHE74_00021088 [Ensete ventricosum]|nr:hypothetical protein GW17_00026214 [Ensete ventricosum]RWW71181.1 hypothetical protein BHE74_00021088 [Ensete ventricosum]RZR90468.1 hypothetical protein BHM03_00018355 [Ensete ventricosum]